MSTTKKASSADTRKPSAKQRPAQESTVSTVSTKKDTQEAVEKSPESARQATPEKSPETAMQARESRKGRIDPDEYLAREYPGLRDSQNMPLLLYAILREVVAGRMS
jgi:hypothetical protein